MSGSGRLSVRAALTALVAIAAAGNAALAVSDAVLERTPIVRSGGHSHGMCFRGATQPEGPIVSGQPPPPVAIFDPTPCPRRAKHHPQLCLRPYATIVATTPAQATAVHFMFYGRGWSELRQDATRLDQTGLKWQFRAPGRRHLNGELVLQVSYPDQSNSGWGLPICRRA